MATFGKDSVVIGDETRVSDKKLNHHGKVTLFCKIYLEFELTKYVMSSYDKKNFKTGVDLIDAFSKSYFVFGL